MRNEQTIEILSPAGGPEALYAAVKSGADAVYLGASAFSARANAVNFSDETLREAVEYCHARGVKVYLTVNTMLHEQELFDAMQVIRLACKLHVDSVLVQDMGLFSLIKQTAPALTLHASTQMSIGTAAGTRLLGRLGAKRVVLARELSLKEIRAIADATDTELESFVHGALCMSVSGQCYFSAMLGSRSGNRGLCAQPCRLPFSNGVNTHALSLKDLSFIDRVGELQQAGVCCAKIEGRMKRPEYVAAATAACRSAIDTGVVPPQQMEFLQSTFSRSGFTDGYLCGHTGYAMFGTRTKEDVTAADEHLFKQIRMTYQKEYKKFGVTFTLTVQENTPLTLTAATAGKTVTVMGEPPLPAAERAISRERCEEQLQKTGDSPFFFAGAVCHLQEGFTCPVSAVNALRRQALERLLQALSQREEIPFAFAGVPACPVHTPRAFTLRGFFTKPEQIPANADRLETVYLPVSVPMEIFTKLAQKGLPMAAALPRILFGKEQTVRRLIEEKLAAGVKIFHCPTIDSLALAKECGVPVLHGGFSLNIANTAALTAFAQLGLNSAELSAELTYAQCEQIGGELPRGAVVYGRLPLMLCRNCPIASTPRGCLQCKEPHTLTDRMGAKFPVVCTGGEHYRCTEVLNCVPTYVAEELGKLAHTDFGVLRFTVENSVESAQIIEAFLRRKKADFVCTHGLFQRGVQ